MKALLLEIGCEELPATVLPTLASSLHTHLLAGLNNAQISCGLSQWFATPRRLAVLVHDVALQQPMQSIERRGPALASAYDLEGKPTLMLQGFLKSADISASQLIEVTTAKGVWLFYRDTEIGKQTVDLLPAIINLACKKLPIPKLMRWGSYLEQFIRPVRWTVLLFGSTVVKATILGKQAGRVTYGHRFMAPQAITLRHASDYEPLLLTKGKVIADFEKRKNIISRQIKKISATKQARALLDENLLTEVCGLVEWPTALLANFDKTFLASPPEVIISTMQQHQKCFALLDTNASLLPHFITVSNIKSRSPKKVIHGNEKVMRARLADATFFYNLDLQQPLTYYAEKLKTMAFQQKLGTLFDKTQRIAQLAKFIFEKIRAANTLKCAAEVTSEMAYTAGLLCKADLTTHMVGEFPALQGIMGYYYAKNDPTLVEQNIIAHAIRDHYKPRFAGDAVDISIISATVALADKIDTLIGIFSIQQQPSGEKDPFALRRAALGVIRIILENNYHLALTEILIKAATLFPQPLSNPRAVTEVFTFIGERLRFYLPDAGLFNAAFACQKNDLYDCQLRISALKHSLTLPATNGLIAANKRVSNMLAKAVDFNASSHVNESLLSAAAEQALWHNINTLTPLLSSLCEHKNYTAALENLASLKTPIDRFFDTVMVQVENRQLRDNRLALLKALQALFLKIADLALLA